MDAVGRVSSLDDDEDVFLSCDEDAVDDDDDDCTPGALPAGDPCGGAVIAPGFDPSTAAPDDGLDTRGGVASGSVEVSPTPSAVSSQTCALSPPWHPSPDLHRSVDVSSGPAEGHLITEELARPDIVSGVSTQGIQKESPLPISGHCQYTTRNIRTYDTQLWDSIWYKSLEASEHDTPSEVNLVVPPDGWNKNVEVGENVPCSNFRDMDIEGDVLGMEINSETDCDIEGNVLEMGINSGTDCGENRINVESNSAVLISNIIDSEVGTHGKHAEIVDCSKVKKALGDVCTPPRGQKKHAEIVDCKVSIVDVGDTVDSKHAEIVDCKVSIGDVGDTVDRKHAEIVVCKVSIVDVGDTVDSKHAEIVDCKVSIGDVGHTVDSKHAEIVDCKVSIGDVGDTVESKHAEIVDCNAQAFGDVGHTVDSKHAEIS
ncbi:hypothetical protein Btru_029695 [Bulinus truncatus]|nr:hypothetical protein Btru_029695 [Bulinus truncatus]